MTTKHTIIAKAVRNLGIKRFGIKNNGDIEYFEDNVEQPTQAEINAKVKELEAQAEINKAFKNLQDLCDTKSVQAKNYINGGKVTVEQLARYEEKYKIAKEYKASGNYADVLKLEADMQGITVDKLAELIIKAGDAYKQALIEFNAKIEAFRVKVKGLIKAGEIDRANMIIEKAKKLGADATDNDIAVLFKE